MTKESKTLNPGRTAWQIDPAHTLVELSVRHMMFSTVKGRFGALKGTIWADPQDPAHSRVEVEIDAASIDTRDEKRDAHLRSPDFLDAESHPTVTFRSTRVQPLDGERFWMEGELTLRGTTRPVTLEGRFNGQGQNPWGQSVAGFSATGAIRRSDFGLTWNAPLEAGGVLVGDEVKFNLEVQAIRQEEVTQKAA